MVIEIGENLANLIGTALVVLFLIVIVKAE